MLASGFLVLAAATEHARHPPRLGLIPLTCNAIQHRFAVLVANIGHRLRWSRWRRRHQAALVPATTVGKPADREDHALRLEY